MSPIRDETDTKDLDAMRICLSVLSWIVLKCYCCASSQSGEERLVEAIPGQERGDVYHLRNVPKCDR